jgi:hypothetical protein
MSTPPTGPGQQQPSEEELRAAYEAEIKRLRVEDVLVQTVVSLINLGGRKAGLAPGAEDEQDLDQLALAVEGARALLPLVEPALGEDAGQVRNALSQLQMAYAQGSGQPGGGGAGGPQGGQGGGAPQGGAGQRGAGQGGSSGLWVPGQ